MNQNQNQLDHSDSEMDLADTSHSSGVSAAEDSFDDRIRESTQATEPNSDDMNASDQETSPSHLRPEEDRVRLQQRSSNARRSVQDLEELVYALYEKYSTSSEGEDSNSRNGIILAGKLPEVFRAFDEQKGQALIEPQTYPVLEDFARDYPGLKLEPATVIQLIQKLEAAAEGGRSDAETADAIQEVISDAPTSSSSSDDDPDSMDDSLREDENHSRTTLPRRDSNLRFPSTSTNGSSISSPNALGRETPEPYERSSTPKRPHTLSDPSSPFKGRAGSVPLEDSARTRPKGRKSRERRVSTEERNLKSQDEVKDVLRGKGKLKGPPVSYSRRPLPPAIAADRARRLSTDTNGNGPPGERSGSVNEDSRHAPRRFVSQPSKATGMADESDEDSGSVGNAPPFPRSASSGSASGFQFPRATSPNAAEQQEMEDEAWEGVISGRPQLNRNPSRSTSPVLDATSQFQGFGALSPPYLPPQSSNLHLENQEHIQQKSLLERNLREANERYDSLQQQYDTDMTGMQAEIDAMKDDLESKRKELKQLKQMNEDLEYSTKETKEKLARTEAEQVRDKKNMSLQKAKIEKLEADLNRAHIELDDSSKVLEHLRGLVGQHNEEASSWAADRNRADETIRDLQSRLETANADLAHYDEVKDQLRIQEGITAAQAAQIEELTTESGHVAHERSSSSVPPSINHRLGSELARFHNAEALDRNFDRADQNRAETEDEGDLSTGSVYEVRRTKKSRGRLPTYNEAKVAKEVEETAGSQERPPSPPSPSGGSSQEATSGEAVPSSDQASSNWLHRQRSAFFQGVSAVVGPKLVSVIPGSGIRSSSTSSTCSTSNLNKDAARLSGAAVLIFVTGMACNRFVFPQSASYYVVSSLLEDPHSWSVANSLASPFELGASGSVGFADGGFNFLGRWLLGSANVIRRVPT